MSVAEAESHVCSSQRLQFDCSSCREVFHTQEDLESHMVNMWCPKLRIFNSMPSIRDIQVRGLSFLQYLLRYLYKIFQFCRYGSGYPRMDPSALIFHFWIRIHLAIIKFTKMKKSWNIFTISTSFFHTKMQGPASKLMRDRNTDKIWFIKGTVA